MTYDRWKATEPAGDQDEGDPEYEAWLEATGRLEPIEEPESLDRWLAPLMIAIAFIALTAWSWRKWPDVLIDFGQQLYIPWQLASGKHLYKDIAMLHGPLSQHFNALWFRIFGPSFTVLIFVNLGVLAGLTTIVYHIFRMIGHRLMATTTCLIFLSVFGFSQYLRTGNYNYVS